MLFRSDPKYGKVRLAPRYSGFFKLVFVSTWNLLIIQLNSLLSQGQHDKYSLINVAKKSLSKDFYVKILEIKTKHQEIICMVGPWRHSITHMDSEALDPGELTINIEKLEKLLEDLKSWLDEVSIDLTNGICSDQLEEVKKSEIVMRDLLLLTNMTAADYSQFIGIYADS